jgi:hypothetical protein
VQNLDADDTRLLQCAQRRASGAAHCSQNFAWMVFSCSQFGHFIGAPEEGTSRCYQVAPFVTDDKIRVLLPACQQRSSLRRMGSRRISTRRVSSIPVTGACDRDDKLPPRLPQHRGQLSPDPNVCLSGRKDLASTGGRGRAPWSRLTVLFPSRRQPFGALVIARLQTRFSHEGR